MRLTSKLQLRGRAWWRERLRRGRRLAPGLRSFPVGNYLIFYRPLEGGIQLIRWLHGAREIIPEYFAKT